MSSPESAVIGGLPNLRHSIPSDSTWPRRARRTSAAFLLVSVFVITLFIANTPAQAAKPVRPTPTPAVCNLVPELRDVTINQGVGAYSPLVRGKEALVRAYLSKPSCASSSDVIELVDASLAVTAGGTTTTIAQPTPAVPSGPYPQLASHTSAALADSTADPLWVIPGSVLAPTSTVNRFTATFTMTIGYRIGASEQTVTFTSLTGSSSPITATVEEKTNAFRVLVVPMGDAGRPFAETYTAAGDAALQAAMLTVSRIFPVPDGVGSLTGTTGGLRYSVSSGMLDLRGLLGSDGRFCGTGGSSGNFNAIKASLGQFLQSWNAANGGDHQADRVLGVVDGSFSNGSSGGCAEGMAAIDSTEAWIRAVPETEGTPSQSGLVAALELGHTFGLVPDARDDPFSRYHSPNPFADPLRLNRSYNTRLRTLLHDDRTAMTYISAANNNNTLLEQADWAYLICKFGGATTSDCTAPTVPVGSDVGVGAEPRFVISGVTDGTAAGTDVLESFFSADILPTPDDPASVYRLVYLDALGGEIADIGMPTTDEDSSHDHDHDEGDAHEEPGISLFSGAFEFRTEAERIELRNGLTDEVLYARDRTGVPVLNEVTVTGGSGEAENYTNDFYLHDTEPALSADGQWIAWAAYVFTEGPTNPAVRVAPIGDAGAAVVLEDGETWSDQPAWCSDGDTLAYVDEAGDLWTVTVDTSVVPVTFGTPVLLHDGVADASHPTWSPDCSQLAFEASNDIWRIDADGDNLVALTDNNRSHEPSWSPDAEDGRIAYVRDVPVVDEVSRATFASFLEPSAEIEPSGFGTPRSPAEVRSSRLARIAGEPLAPVVSVSALVIDSTFTVTSADDADDESCNVTHCSLREAIEAANQTAAADAIEFAIGTGAVTITPATALPDVEYPVEIRGETQPGYGGSPLIRVDGASTDADGLVVLATAPETIVRGLLVTGFAGNGVELAADDSVLEDSWIGVDHAGEAAGNEGHGVLVNGDAVILSDNVISANGNDGVRVQEWDAIFSGNHIGTDPAGDTDLGNGGDGIHVVAADNAIVGGAGVEDQWIGNVISGNDGDGIEFSNGGEGSSLNHRVYGNTIGLNATGDAALANDGHGINLHGAGETYVGMIGYSGDDPARNVISGNGGSGIYLLAEEYDVQFHGNYIGTDATGTIAIGNAESGIFVDRSWDASIGEGDAETRNVISGNAVGITLRRTEGSTSVLGNYIGTNAAGNAALPNGVGIVLDAAADEEIGGRSEGEGNVISGNTGDGIYVAGDGELEIFADGNTIEGNFIGTDATGLLPLGNGGNGITLDYATDLNVIGGDTDLWSGYANVIGDNGGHGISLGISYDNVIQGNFIGTDAGMTEDLGNALAGVRIVGQSSSNQVGAELIEGVSGPGNAIAFNGGNGVELVQAPGDPPFDADFNSIFSNSIWDNGGLGIDLEADGVTPNDDGDDDDASNDLKNFPDELYGDSDGFTTYGTIATTTSAPAEEIIYQLFVSETCDTSGHGEGQRLLDTFYTTADAFGDASVPFAIDEDLEGKVLTATTSDNQGQTSEFSACAEVGFSGDTTAEVWLLDPEDPLGEPLLRVADGDEPAWGPGGILFVAGNAIRIVQPDGTGNEAVTPGDEFDGSPTSGPGVIGFVRDVEGDLEVFLISDSQTVSVLAGDDVPEDLRLDLYYACGGQIMPIAVGLLPSSTGAATASFQYNFDPSLSCSGGEILAALSDGFSRSVTPPGEGVEVESEKKPPVAATYGPPLGSTYVTSDVIAFHGTGEDADDGPLTGDALEWFIAPAGDPCCAEPAVGIGEQVDYDASQLDPGDYIVTLVVTDSDGESDSAESLIHVLADSDNDGFSDDEESTTCFGAGAATDGSTPSGDFDSDGIPNGSDPEPCVRAPAEADATADFDPDEFSLSSKGTWVTIYIESADQDVREIASGSVRIVEIAGETVNIANDGISYKGDRMVVKFRRATLASYFTSHGLTSGNVPITVRGTSNTLPSWSFEASDTTLVQP